MAKSKPSPAATAALAKLDEALRSHAPGSKKAAIKAYLAAGGDLNQAGTADWPLLLRVFLSASLVEFVLDSGADPNVTTGSGRSVLLSVLGYADGDRKQYLASAKAYVAARPNLDLRDKQGETALYAAAARAFMARKPLRYLAFVKLLVDAGADCNLAPKGWPHILDLAVKRDSEATAKKLIAILKKGNLDKAAVARAAKAAEAKGWKDVAKLLK